MKKTPALSPQRQALLLALHRRKQGAHTSSTTAKRQAARRDLKARLQDHQSIRTDVAAILSTGSLRLRGVLARAFVRPVPGGATGESD